MTRQTQDQPITTRTARERLAMRSEPYWRALDTGTGLGYRKGQGGGSWIARMRFDGGYRYGALGRADDAIKPDGMKVLDYRQAAEKAKAWAAGQHRIASGIDPEHPKRPFTVEQAIAEYLTDYRARGGKSLRDTEIVISAHILPRLGNRKVADLTSATIRAWHRALAAAPARLRSSGKDMASIRREHPVDDPDLHRARRATANRVLTVLKAALNLAYREQRVPTDDAWRRVKPFGKVNAARVRYLTDPEIARLVDRCPDDLRALVTAALLTGCRYGELATLRSRDIVLTSGNLTVRGKSGERTVVLTKEAQRHFETLAAGKSRTDLVLLRANKRPWGKSHQFRPLREACATAKITPVVSFHILRHTHASRLAMRGVPMAVIAAQLGHSDVKLTGRHYAHLSPGYVADTVRQAFGDLGLVPNTSVTPITVEGIA